VGDLSGVLTVRRLVPNPAYKPPPEEIVDEEDMMADEEEVVFESPESTQCKVLSACKRSRGVHSLTASAATLWRLFVFCVRDCPRAYLHGLPRIEWTMRKEQELARANDLLGQVFFLAR